MKNRFKKIVVIPINIDISKPNKKGKAIILKDREDIIFFFDNYMSEWFEVKDEQYKLG